MAPFIVYDGSYEIDLPPCVPPPRPAAVQAIAAAVREAPRPMSPIAAEIDYDGSYEAFIDLPMPESPRLVSTKSFGLQMAALRI